MVLYLNLFAFSYAAKVRDANPALTGRINIVYCTKGYWDKRTLILFKQFWKACKRRSKPELEDECSWMVKQVR